jgi:hypothetical protein
MSKKRHSIRISLNEKEHKTQEDEEEVGLIAHLNNKDRHVKIKHSAMT